MAWLSGWNYRKSVTLSRASGAVTNYQMKLLVGESSGASGEDVDCGGLCQSDFDDLRFTTSDGETLLDYWIESKSGTTPNQLATVWIEFDSIGTSATTFYMYYGNASASAASNGGDTFLVFDDLEYGEDGGTLTGAVTQRQNTAKISTDHAFSGTRCCKVYGMDGSKNSVAHAAHTAGDNDSELRVRAWKEGNTRAGIGMGKNNYSVSVRIETNEVVTCYPNSTNLGTMPADQWVEFVVNAINYTAKTYNLYMNGNLLKSGAAMESSIYANNVATFAALYCGSGNDFYVDNVLIRNWRATEPAWGSWGSQETASRGLGIYAPNVSWLSKSLLKRREI